MPKDMGKIRLKQRLLQIEDILNGGGGTIVIFRRTGADYEKKQPDNK